MKFGEFLKDLRIRKGLKLRDVEKATGISNSYLSQVETGKRNPPHPDILKKLAPVYGVTIGELMTKAGYLEQEMTVQKEDMTQEQELDWAFNIVKNDPLYKEGARDIGDGEITPNVKRFVIQMYERYTGRKLLTK
ncbi:helix-turn-helix domain-containing protein [candidate division KSB1 bacterium]|nr:helix-turn-helix domain-containing protein [candidate division KSB1 bacterium]